LRARAAIDNPFDEWLERLWEDYWSRATVARMFPHVRGGAAPLRAWNYSSGSGKEVFLIIRHARF
jgi:hypothetical protein